MPGCLATQKSISADWGGLPGNIDTAVTWKDTGATYIFKGNQYWKFNNKRMKPGYPKAISDGFPGIPRDLDAAILAAANNKMYFFKVNTSIAHVTTNLTFRVTTTGDLNLGR